MITVADVLRNDHYKDEIQKTINSNGWAILMEVAKNNLMRPPDPRIEKPNFGSVAPEHVAPVLYGISLGMWEMVEKLTNLHTAQDVATLGPIEETYGSKGILEGDDDYQNWLKQKEKREQKKAELQKKG